MRVAVIGSRGLTVRELERYLPENTTEIVSGGARGVDASAARYAREHGIPLKEFLPDYELYGKRAPLMRNLEIIDYADMLLAFWDGRSKGTMFTVQKCRKAGKPVRLFLSEGALNE